VLSIEKLNSAEQAISYHEHDYANSSGHYYSQGGAASVWRGPMAAELGLSGEVAAEAYAILACGQPRLRLSRWCVTGECLTRQDYCATI
jgi:hypothetical protein